MAIRRRRGASEEVYMLYHGVFGGVCKYNDGRLAYYHGDTEHIEYLIIEYLIILFSEASWIAIDTLYKINTQKVVLRSNTGRVTVDKGRRIHGYGCEQGVCID